MVMLPLNSLYNYVQSKKFCLSTSQQVKEITEPLVKFLGGSGFDFHRMYKDGSRVYLSTSPEWIEHFYSNHFMQCSDYNSFLGKKLMLWKHWPYKDDKYSKLIHSAQKNLGVDNGIIANYSNSEYIDSFEFRGFISDHEINHRHLSNIDIIEKYIIYFKIHAAELITQAHQYKVVIPVNISISSLNNYEVILPKLKHNVFHELKDIRLVCNENNATFTKRETECIFLMILGKTTKEIAKEMNISPRTIEDNINSIKFKLGCSFKSQIVSIVNSYPMNKMLISHFLAEIRDAN